MENKQNYAFGAVSNNKGLHGEPVIHRSVLITMHDDIIYNLQQKEAQSIAEKTGVDRNLGYLENGRLASVFQNIEDSFNWIKAKESKLLYIPNRYIRGLKEREDIALELFENIANSNIEVLIGVENEKQLTIKEAKSSTGLYLTKHSSHHIALSRVGNASFPLITEYDYMQVIKKLSLPSSFL